MVIKDKLVSDLELRLSKLKPHKDLNLNRSLLAHWIDSSRDQLVIQKIAIDLQKLNVIDSAFIFHELRTVALDATSGKYVITPTKGIIQLPDGRGIVQVVNITDGYNLIKTDYDKFDEVDLLRYARPELTRLFWYVDYYGHIVIHPADATTISKSLLLKYVRADWGSDTALSEEYPITSDLIDPLLDIAMQKAAQTLQIGQFDVLNNDIAGE